MMNNEIKSISKAREAIVALIEKKKSEPQVEKKIPVTVIPAVARRSRG